MDYKLILAILTIVLTSLVAIVVYVRNPKSDVAKSFVILILTFAVWGIAQATLYATSSLQIAYVADVSTYFFGLLIAWSFFTFSYLFPYKAARLNKYILGSLLILTIISFVTILSPGGVVQSVYNNEFGYAFINNKYSYGFYTLVFFLIFGYAYNLLIQKYRSSSAENRLLTLHVIYSSLVPVVAGSLFNLIFILFKRFEYQIYGPSFTLIFTITVAYLIFLRGRK